MLVLSAFDLAVHADPRDYYDLTQGFVMGVNEAEKTLIAQRNVESWTELSSDGAAENSEIHEATTSGTTSSNTQKKRRRSDRNKKVFSPKDRPLRYRYEQYRRSTWSEDGLDNNKKVASKLDNEATAALFEDTVSLE